MKTIGIIYGSSRPSTTGKTVAEWFVQKVGDVEDISFEMVDLKDLNLPMLDEPMPPMMDQYQHDHTKAWAEKISGFDGIIFVPAEYNLSPTPILKNAIDYLGKEWSEKPVAFISYGSFPVSESVVMLRKIMSIFKTKQVEETLHVTPSYKAVSDDGVDESMVVGAEPKVIVSKLVDLL